MAQFVVARSLIEIGLDAVIMNEQLCHRALDIHGLHVKLVGVVFMALRFFQIAAGFVQLRFQPRSVLSLAWFQSLDAKFLAPHSSQLSNRGRQFLDGTCTRGLLCPPTPFFARSSFVPPRSSFLGIGDAARSRRSFNWISPAGHCGQQVSPPPR